ncbi:E3 ubiquitin-protein ligase XIAP-like [Salvelinus alpinus]|uniref:E3 ubiquitin-protein ligase XIAP-like n=1 Tax=Salvelinus alpinus TaxID=8036 RepID=UPI0039FC325D
MSGPGRDSDLESDHAVDWSMMDMRLDSFRGSLLAQQVSAERLARAGFYFTGQADKVRCFSCHKTVENWCGGDAPAERHAEVSPTCKFLSCTHRSRVNSLQGAMLTNEPHYNEDAEDMEFRLRTGEVVDESTYPMVPHMVSEDSRFNTLGPWPSTSSVQPRELAQAGLFYMGSSDRVQCFCCGGMLGGWQPGDTAWGEHSKHFPYCFFILGHDVGNLPSQAGREGDVGETRPRPGPRVPMQSFEERLGSFAGIQHTIDHERLARAGFYNTGAPDRVVCFCCGGGLKGWQPDENPWEEHAKHYPGCSFLLAEKGQEFVSSVQLQGPDWNNAASSHLNGCSSHGTEVLRSAMAQRAVEMGLEPALVERTILERIRRAGTGYSTLETLLQDCFNRGPDSDAETAENHDEDPFEKLRKLQREKQCKVCMDRDICIVFIPCGHLVVCKECSEALGKCPICCAAITQKIKTYIS